MDSFTKKPWVGKMIVVKKQDEIEDVKASKEAEFSDFLREAMQDPAFGVPRPSADLQQRLRAIPQQHPRSASRSLTMWAALFPTAGVAAVLVFLFLGQPPIDPMTSTPSMLPPPIPPPTQRISHPPVVRRDTLPTLRRVEPPVVRRDTPPTLRGVETPAVRRDTPPTLRRIEPPVLRRMAASPSGLVAKGTLWEPLYAHQRGAGLPRQSRILRDGVVLYPGDLVQWSYKISAPVYVFLVGMNRDGEVYPLLPQPPEPSAIRLERLQGSLPQADGEARAFRLDHYIGAERFFVFQSSKPFSFQEVKRELLSAWEISQKKIEKMVLVSTVWSIYTVYFVKKARED